MKKDKIIVTLARESNLPRVADIIRHLRGVEGVEIVPADEAAAQAEPPQAKASRSPLSVFTGST